MNNDFDNLENQLPKGWMYDIGGSRTKVNVGDKIWVLRGDRRFVYTGIVKEDLYADLKCRNILLKAKHHIKNADLTSNYYRLVQLNEQRLHKQEKTNV